MLKQSGKQYNSLVQRRIVAFLLVAMMLFNPLLTSQTVYGMEEITAGCGHLEVTMPSGTDSMYTVKLTLNRTSTGDSFYTLTNTEQYLVTLTFANGTTEERAVALEQSSWPDLVGSISNIPAGTTVTVKNILVETGDGTVWGDFVDTFVFLEISSSDITERVVLEENALTMQEGAVTQFEVDTSGDVSLVQNLTDDTFLNRDDPYASEDGSYSLQYLLSNYNVVSLKDIEATHIVGPIISQYSAYRTGDAYTGATHDGSDLVASDYSRGVSSYVGQPVSLTTNANTSAVQLGYGFDNEDADFTPPHFYTRETNIDGLGFISVSEVTENWETKNYIHLSSTGESFLSPNNMGVVDNHDMWGVMQDEKTYTYQNDDFIDFEAMWSSIQAESLNLLTTGALDGETTVNVIYDAVTDLELEAGKSYLIKDATHLETVNIILPEDYDFFVNPWLPPTIISFEGNTINPAVYQGLAVSQFPETLVNGEQLATLQGHGGEYSEVGNRIVWNLPNVVTTGTTNRLVTYAEGVNIAGHIVAPNAEFWNINSSGAWEGGNLNGTAIVADFHSGNMEMHMWAYGGWTEKSTYVSLEVAKTFTNGDLADQSFQFTLTPADDRTETQLGELYDFPLVATTNTSGMAYFEPLVFEDSGEYAFYVEEVIPEETGAVTYDTSRYLVELSILAEHTMDDNGTYVTTYTNTCTYTLLDNAGNQEASALHFTNVQEVPQETAYSFTKVDSAANPLAGATFVLVDADPAGNETVWETPLDSQISGVDGLVTFEGLLPESTYYMKESVAPEGYILPTGYWVLVVDAYGVITVTAMENAPTITDKQLVNTLMDAPLATVTLSKENQYGVGLEGAEFLVERVYSMNAHVVVEGAYSATYTSDAQGQMIFTDLPLDGVYRITEQVAPDGYTLPFNVNYWIVEVVTDSTQEAGYSVTLYAVDIVDDGYDLTVLDNDFTLLNMDVYVLPSTGGQGTTVYYVAGLLLLCGGAVLSTYAGKKKEREI
ncbi:SpaA isopeptide-forming pilin-related protein [Bengtsoniella intestinalis]|uniref:SpaA isopeptide-forming pilin-related protein n=1 Tax=Bengtsoniella intestinalis TaxID=3073143 RepID=UPI00391EEBF4